MAGYEWQNSDVWRNINPRKKAIISALIEQSKNKKMEETAGIVMAAINQMKRERLSFSKNETEMLFQLLTAGMSNEERAKVELMKSFLR